MDCSTARDRLAVLALVVVMSAACSSPSAPPTPTPSVATTSPRYGAPVVSHPLDVAQAFADPCRSLLSAAELRAFDIVESGRSRSYLGDSECFWTSRGQDTLSLAVDDNRDLLADTYQTHLLPIFVPTEIEGYPSVRQQSNPRYNTCTVTTGLGPLQALQADWTGIAPVSPAADPCQRAEDAIALVIRKLPPQK